MEATMNKDVVMSPIKTSNRFDKIRYKLSDAMADQPDETSAEEIKENDQIIEEFKQNAKNLVIKYACEYFKDKNLHIGGKITKQILLNDKLISTVLNSNIIDSIATAHQGIEKNEDLFFRSSLYGTDGCAKMIIDILYNISGSSARIPKEFAGGLLLLHLELCEGVVFES